MNEQEGRRLRFESNLGNLIRLLSSDYVVYS